MKNSKRIIIIMLVVLFTAGITIAAEEKVKLSAKDEDGFILYEYSNADAMAKRSKQITETVEKNKTTYKFDKHELSCGTVMTGFIERTKQDTKEAVKGDFKVTESPFKIDKLSFDFTEEGSRYQGYKRVGTITIDGKTLDVKLFDR